MKQCLRYLFLTGPILVNETCLFKCKNDKKKNKMFPVIMDLSRVLNEVCRYRNFPCCQLKNRQLLFRLLWQQQQRKLDHYNAGELLLYCIIYVYIIYVVHSTTRYIKNATIIFSRLCWQRANKLIFDRTNTILLMI